MEEIDIKICLKKRLKEYQKKYWKAKNLTYEFTFYKNGAKSFDFS